MRVFRTLAVAAVLATAGAASAEPANPPPGACRMSLIAELKVSFKANKPIFEARIDGRPVRMLIDTGAFSTTLFAPSAKGVGGRSVESIGDVGGVGGRRAAYRAVISDLQLGEAHFKSFPVLLLDGPPGREDMLMGRDFLSRADIEFDLAHDVVRFLKPEHCASDQMPYWAKTGYSQAPLLSSLSTDPIRLNVQLNGKTAHAVLDSGAAVSIATFETARRAGVAAVAKAGEFRGVGPGSVAASIGEVDSFSVGDETIRRTRLAIADIHRGDETTALGSHIGQRASDAPEMLLGADFLKAHHVLVSYSHRTLYFTYEGGAVFDTTHAPATSSTATAQAAASRGAPAGS